MSEMDEFARGSGFEDERDMNRLVASIPLTDPSARAAFVRWKEEDGTKAGLLALLQEAGNDGR